jgi:hypothetical protein
MSRPSGVRILRPDGDPIELDDMLENGGPDDQGIDQWYVKYDFRPGVDKLVCDVLPGRTSIGVLVPATLAPMDRDLTVESEWTDKRGETKRTKRTFKSMRGKDD